MLDINVNLKVYHSLKIKNVIEGTEMDTVRETNTAESGAVFVVYRECFKYM